MKSNFGTTWLRDNFATKCTSWQAYALQDTLTVTNICHEVILRSREFTDCPEHALVTNLFVANIRRLRTNICKMSPTVGAPHFCFVTNIQNPAPTLSRQYQCSRSLSFIVINFLAPALRIEISFALAWAISDGPSPIPIEFGSNCSSHCCYDGGIG